jgi:radical SAM protein with 4Fe4S-binding SPASM domain
MKIAFVNASERCSNNCEHCYLGERDNPTDLPLYLAETFFKQLAALDQHIVAIEGDHSHLDEIVDIAVRTGLEVTVSASSDYLEENIEVLADKIKSLVVSLDGGNPRIHDRVRGSSGSFDKTIETIKEIQKRGGHVAVLTALSKRNISDFDEFSRFLLGLDVDIISFLYTSSFGNAKSKDLSIPPSEWKRVSQRIERLREESSTRIFYEPVFCDNNFQDKNLCSLYTRDYMAIDPLGNVYFCPLFINKEECRYALGNITRDKLSDIWLHSPNWEKFREMKDNLDNCHGCQDYDSCGGECFADLVLNKTEDQPKTLCYLHWNGL